MVWSHKDISSQIANLLNHQNRLTTRYTQDMILRKLDKYLYETQEDFGVIGCVCVKKVQWYQAEICHLSVHPYMQNHGIGLRMMTKAEDRCRDLGVRIAQATVRCDNKPCLRINEKRGFKIVNQFGDIIIYQKVLNA
jgi:N-acetylglutamate synthase-like GNAT family acetyltransferase